MDAKAVADQIYREHSMRVTEEEVLHAQAWLQEERKINETPPATEKKDESMTSTAPVQPPPTAPVREPPTSASTAPSPQNTPVLPSSGAVPDIVLDNVPAPSGQRVGAVPAASEQPTDLPDVLKAAHALTDEQAISNCTIAYQQHSMAVSKRVSFRKRFKTFRNSKMLLSSGTFRNI